MYLNRFLECWQDAETQIDNPNWKYEDNPYTVQLGGCGEPGKLIHLTPNYLMNFDTEANKLKFGPAGGDERIFHMLIIQ